MNDNDNQIQEAQRRIADAERELAAARALLTKAQTPGDPCAYACREFTTSKPYLFLRVVANQRRVYRVNGSDYDLLLSQPEARELRRILDIYLNQ